MPVLAKMALRSLVAHKAKSLIVGTLIAFGVVILVAGISFLDTASLGLRKSFIDSFTGDVMISGKTDASISLFGVQSMGGTETTPVIPRSDEVLAYVRAQPGVRSATPQVTGANQINIEGNDLANVDSLVFLFGIEPESYRAMFDNLDLAQGRYLLPGEQGIMLSTPQVASLNKELKTEIKVGGTVIIQNFATAIRAVTVRGIFDFKHRNAALDTICYIDAQSLRALEGMGTGRVEEGVLPGIDTSLLERETKETDLFSGKGNVVRIEAEAARPAAPSLQSRAPGAAAEPAASPRPENVPWHFILVDLKNQADAPRFIAETNRWLSRSGIDAVAAGWERAAGPFGTMPNMIRILFVVAILVVSVVAIIIIMNTLVASVLERTSEIGTMRALGAKKGFIWRLFLIETLTISIVFGLAGMAIGAAVVGALNIVGVPATNIVLQTLVGGPDLRPVLSASALGASVVVFLMIGIVAHLYPVAVAVRIPPIRAIQAGQYE